MTAPFETAMAVSRRGGGVYDAELASAWTIGPKVHGGTLQALCAAAAKAELAHQRGGPDDPGGAGGANNAVGAGGVEPVAVSADFLGAPDPGAMELRVHPRKLGRRVSVLDVELAQGGRVAVRAAVTLAVPDSGDPLVQVPGPGHAIPPEPPADALELRGSPMESIVHLAQVCDMRMDRASAAFANGGRGDPELRLWVRPHGEGPSALFALMCGDICAPVTLNLGRFGWAPTIQLSTYVRRVPEPGWLRVVASSSVVGQVWFEEDQVVLDQSGAVVAQGRQLAMVPAPPG